MLATCVVGIVLAAWAALITQSLASRGTRTPYFASIMDLRRAPEDDYVFTLGADFVFYDSNGEATRCPAGMQTDGASVGALLGIPIVGLLIVWIIKGDPLRGALAPAAVPHDKRYADAQDSTIWRALISPDRAVADRVIFEAARCRIYVIGAHQIFRQKPLATWRAFVVMAVLRIAGAKPWLDDSRAAHSMGNS